MTNVESHLVTHKTEEQAPSKLSNTRSRRFDISLLRRALRVNQDHHLPGPPPQRTTACSRAAMPHKPITRSPSYTGPPAADDDHHINSSGAAAPT